MSEAAQIRNMDTVARYRVALLAIGLGLVALAFAFSEEGVRAVHQWVSSTAYNHCFLILPIAAWLFWDRRHRLHDLTPRPFPLAVPLAAAFAIVWFIAQRLGVMEGRQLLVVAMLQALLLGVLGPSVYRAMIAPFLYLFFLVPFGGFLVPALKHFTTHFVGTGLDVLGIPNYVHGNDIEIAQGTFRIADACAGLRFLIAAIAFSVLYALLIFRSTGRRLLFIAISLVVPVIANGFRALGIVWLGHALGSAQAAATDHVLYGYIFFSIVLAALILLGLPFREDGGGRPIAEETAGTGGDPGSSMAFLPALGIGVIAILISLAGGALDRAAARNPVQPPEHFAGCSVVPGTTVASVAAQGGRAAHFSCGDGTIKLAIVAFPRQVDPEPVVDTRRRLGGLNWPEAAYGRLRIDGRQPAWTLVVNRHQTRVAVSLFKLDGHLSNGGMHARLRMVLHELSGRGRPVYVIAATTKGPPDDATHRLRRFLAGAYPAMARLGVSAGEPSVEQGQAVSAMGSSAKG